MVVIIPLNQPTQNNTTAHPAADSNSSSSSHKPGGAADPAVTEHAMQCTNTQKTRCDCLLVPGRPLPFCRRGPGTHQISSR